MFVLRSLSSQITSVCLVPLRLRSVCRIAMAMVASNGVLKRKRVSTVRFQTVPACVKILDGWMYERSSRDVVALLKPLAVQGYKLAPRVEALAKVADLFGYIIIIITIIIIILIIPSVTMLARHNPRPQP